MISLIAFWSGLKRAAARKRMVVLYWFFHTLCALLVTLPMMAFIVPAVSHSRYGDELLRAFDLAWIAELITSTDGLILPVAASSMIGAAIVALVGAACLAGGAVPLLADTSVSYSPAQFWQNAGRNFWRYLRLAIYSAVPYGLALALFGGLGKAAQRVWGEGMAEGPVAHTLWIRTALLILAAGLVSTAMDFAKVRLAVEDSRRSLRACFGALRLVWRNPGVVFWLWVSFALCWMVLVWASVRLANFLQAGPSWLFAPAVLVQQTYVLLRVFLRFAAWGAAAELDLILRPQPAQQPGPEPSPTPPAGVPSEPPAAPDYPI